MGRSRIYSVNDQFFKVIDVEEKAYWLGFLAADGGISSKRPRLSLSQSHKDKSQLEKFKEALDSSYPIYNHKIKKRGYLGYRLRITSKELVDDLADKGVIPKKSLILKPPQNVPSYLIRHWIRGYFDGDGSVGIYIDKRKGRNGLFLRTNIIGTKEVLKFILDQVGLDQPIKQGSNSKAFVFRISGVKGLQLYYYMYNTAIIYLERKRKKFEEYIKFYPNKYLQKAI